MSEFVSSEGDARTVNNAVRHQYRVLSDAEKAQMLAVKDKGAEFLALIRDLYPVSPPFDATDQMREVRSVRELHYAEKKVEEAVMWAVKWITG